MKHCCTYLFTGPPSYDIHLPRILKRVAPRCAKVAVSALHELNTLRRYLRELIKILVWLDGSYEYFRDGSIECFVWVRQKGHVHAVNRSTLEVGNIYRLFRWRAIPIWDPCYSCMGTWY